MLVSLLTVVMVKMSADRAIKPTAEQMRFISARQKLIEQRLKNMTGTPYYDRTTPPRIGVGAMRGWTLPSDHELAQGPTLFFRARGHWVAGPITVSDGTEKWAAFIPTPPHLARQLRLSQWRMISPWWLSAVLAVVCFSAYILSRQLSRPIVDLEHQAQPMARGEFGLPISDLMTKRKDEVGTLARTLNRVSAAAHQAITAQQRLLGDISHELRSPLVRINLAASLVERKKGQSTEIDRIHHEVQQLNLLVGELLELSRDSLAQSELDWYILNPLIKSAGKDHELNQRHIEIITVTPEQDIEVKASPGLIRKIVYNLLDNAVRHAKRKVYLQLTLSEHCPVILVEDDGDGMDDAHFDDVFKPFFRPDESRERNSGGVGLGLAIVKSAVTLLQGTIDLQRSSHGGLAVTVRLPISHD